MTATERADTAPSRLIGKISQWARDRGLGRIFAISLAVAALVSGIATYAALTGAPPLGDSPTLILLLLNVDLALLLLLAVVVARHIVAIWWARRRGSAGSRLHVRLVVLFGLVSVTPAIVVAVFSVLFFNFGVESWFSDRVRTALTESMAAADTYLREHKRNIRNDALAMARDLSRDTQLLTNDPRRFNQTVRLQATVRELTEAVVFDGSGLILARSGQTYMLEFEPIPKGSIEQARAGQVAIMTSENDDRVRALVRLDGPVDSFLYVGRLVDPTVLGHMERTRGAVAQFEQLEIQRSDLQISFALIFVVVGLLLLLAAVWVGLLFATQLSRPISALILATEKVRAGDLSVRVPEDVARDEVGSLSRAFNRMTNELEVNRSELVEANLQLDERRRFTETVLSGVSAGIIGLDEKGQINLPNRSASELLGIEVDEIVGHSLEGIVPEMAELLETARVERRQRPVDGEITLKRGRETRTLLVRVGVEWDHNDIKGVVV
ncbi:MAG: HAMP domain-containing protein, partial [Alphaproteobacteria bacterium]|nr:HAMP domain-containing protein [Alphaproteobacteria bacterium]